MLQPKSKNRPSCDKILKLNIISKKLEELKLGDENSNDPNA
jgi:hypothetical protein